eukprot:COSAG02_NODE_7355_length_3049_cov_4.730169_4_plen_308_part_00
MIRLSLSERRNCDAVLSPCQIVLNLVCQMRAKPCCGVCYRCVQMLDGVLQNHPNLQVVPVAKKPVVREDSTAYDLPPDADRLTKLWHSDTPRKRAWRHNEASDFIFLMRHLLERNPQAAYIGLHQDDAVWTQPPELLASPVQSLYHFRAGGPIAASDTQSGIQGFSFLCHLPCGLVSTVFKRDVLEQFLGTITKSSGSAEAWRLKPIDQLLEDFVRANGLPWHATRSTQHKGSTSSYSFTKDTDGRARPLCNPPPSLGERHHVYSCERVPPAMLDWRAREFCEGVTSTFLKALPRHRLITPAHLYED